MTPEALTVLTNGVRFRALAAGANDAPLVLLLHDFPELARSWRHQLPALADAGYRAVAPDLRGYGESDKHGPHDLRTLADDAAGLVRALGHERAVVVGHDWGGAVAWMTAHYEPQVVDRLVVLNAPHPATMPAELLRNPRQLLRSSYILFFQLPWLPERLLAARRAAAVALALRAGSRVDSAWSREELEHYRRAFADSGAASAALAYYRAAFREPLAVRRAARAHAVESPTLVLWGLRDPSLGPELIAPEKLAPWLAPGNVPDIVRIESAGHFVQNETPERVNHELLRWLASDRAAPASGRREAGRDNRGREYGPNR